MLHDLFKSIMRRCDLESRECLAAVAPGGILLPSVILGKSAKSWGVIAKNSGDSGSAQVTAYVAATYSRLASLHLNLEKPEARHTKPLPCLPALFHLTHCT